MKPRRLLLAWELGAGYGHLAPLRAAARHLTGIGHHCSFAVSDLVSAARLELHRYGPVFAAPPAPAPAGIARPVKIQASYASLLHNSGFDEVLGLSTRLRAWRELLIATGSAALLADHAPTALLAARTLGLPRAMTGTGFTLPPVQTPFPAFPVTRASEAILLRNEQQVLKVTNAALGQLNAAPLSALQQLFADLHPGLKTYADLDHYGLPRPTPYLGLPDFSEGLRLNWGAPGERRILAYLRPFPGLEPLLQALARVQAQVLVRIADLPLDRLQALQRPGLVFTDQAIWLRQAAETCDAFVNYGAHGATAELLLAGKPVLLIPTTVERQLLAARAERLGAALVLPPRADQDYAAALQRLLDDDHLRVAAASFASRHGGQDRARILPDWLDGWLAACG